MANSQTRAQGQLAPCTQIKLREVQVTLGVQVEHEGNVGRLVMLYIEHLDDEIEVRGAMQLSNDELGDEVCAAFVDLVRRLHDLFF